MDAPRLAPCATGWVARLALAWIAWAALAAPPLLAQDAAGEDAWADPAALEARWARALAAVEEAQAQRFGQRPPLRVVAADEMRAALRRDPPPALRGWAEAHPSADLAATVPAAALARYLAGSHEVLACPALARDAAARLRRPGLLEGGVVDAVLAREAAHAWQRERLRFGRLRAERTAPDARRVLDALSSAHATLVAQLALARQGTGEEALVELGEAWAAQAPAAEGTEDAAAARADVAYAQRAGGGFLAAILRALDAPAIEAVLRDPPADPSALEDPDAWLADASLSVGAARLLEWFAPCFPGDAWQVSRVGLPTFAIPQGYALRVPPAERARVVASFQGAKVVEARVLRAVAQDGPESVTVLLVVCASSGDAERFLAAMRAAQQETTADESRPRGWREGAGPGGVLPGYAWQRSAGSEELGWDELGEGARLGRVVVDLTTERIPAPMPEGLHGALGAVAERMGVPWPDDAPHHLTAVELAGRRVTVQVWGPDGAPVVRALVRLEPDGAGFTRMGRTSWGGRARVRVPAQGGYSLVVDPSPDREDLAALPHEAWDGGDAEVRLEAGRTIRGRVLDAEGRPSRADVFVELREGYSRGAPTAPDGTFEVRHVPRDRPVRLRAMEDGAWGPSGRDAGWTTVAPGETTADLRLAEGPSDRRRLSVEIVGHDGTQVEKATVAIEGEGVRGSYTWRRDERECPPWLRGGVLRVRVSGAADARGARLPLGPATVEVGPSERVARVVLPPGRSAKGRLVDEGGHGLAGATVEAHAALGRVEPFGVLSEARTGPDGSFEMDGLGPDLVFFAARCPPGSPWAAPREVPEAAEGGTTVVVCRRAMAARLRVVDYDGKPVAGAAVRVWLGRGSGSWNSSGPGGRTDAEGRFATEALHPDASVALEVTPPAGREDVASPSDPHPGRPAKPGEETVVALARGFTVRGTIRAPGGAPTAGVVLLQEGDPDGEEGSSQREVATAGPDGLFVARGLPAQSSRAVRLVATVVGGAPWQPEPRGGGSGPSWTPSRPVPVSPATPTVDLLLRVAGGAFRVRVVGGAGPRTVQAWPAPDAPREPGAPPRGLKLSATDADGIAAFKDFPPGDCVVFVPAGDDGLTALATVAAKEDGEPVEVRLAPGLDLRLRLKVPAGAGAQDVSVDGPVGTPVVAEPLPDGAFVVRALPPGSYTVHVKVRGPASWLRATVEAQAGAETVIEPK